MPSVPSSGLSLIIHLSIIGVASLLHSVATRVPLPRALVPYTNIALPEHVVKWAKRTISIALIMTLSSLTFFFTIIAIQTGIREGMQESHMQYIGTTLRGVFEVVHPQFIPMTETLTRSITYDRFAVDFLSTPYAIHENYITFTIKK